MTSTDARRVWEWLPKRTDNSRVTLPVTIAASLGLQIREVAAILAEMERGGHAIRDAATGRQSGWHRGKPLPVGPAAAASCDQQDPLF
jgi:hypothetical protein